ncbi:MAG: peptidoglycan synthetase FtsI, partial [Frankiales bacterium]|nr:peptidoglycan synthetase FtsI [Frankiales bacterium]
SAARPAARAAHRTRPAARRTATLGRPGVRLRAGLVILAAIVLLLSGRLVQLQGLQPVALADRSGVELVRPITVPALRGQVLDRNGNPLAVSVLAKNLYAEPRTIAKGASLCREASTIACNPHTIAAALAPLLRLPAASLEAKLKQDKGFVYLIRAVDPALATRVMALGLPGIGQESTTRRVHPSHDLAAGVLGFTDYEGVGKGGIELAMQNVLAGRDGRTVARFDAAGRIIPTGSETFVAPVPGKDVELTLDRDLQWYTQNLIVQQVAATHAINGTAVVMDVKTGEVLALATAPTFDPDRRRDGQTMGNPAISDVYEPGSVNKVITAAAALQDGLVTPETVIEVPPTLKVSNKVLHDAEKHGTEHLTFAGVLAKSSNIGTVKVAMQLGPQRLYDTMRSFGFGTRSGLGLPGESRGVIREPADWSGTSIANIPIGQGISVNAMQVASVYATIANDGVRVTPSIVKSWRDSAGHVGTPQPPATRRVITPVVAQQIREMLEGAVSEQGTAPKAAIPGYRVAGKTGTAQRVATTGPRAGHYDGTYTSSFVGMAPADAPRFVTAVVLQGTGSNGYFGGQVAAPLFSQIMGFALRSYGVTPSGTKPPVLRLSAD